MQIQKITQQVLKEHLIELRAEQGTSPKIKIKVLDNTLVYNGIYTHCGCTNVKVNKTYYQVSIDRLEDVKWMVDSNEIKEYIKTVIFDIIHLDNTLETVKIIITVYDPTEI
jgi:hypothetical protein